MGIFDFLFKSSKEGGKETTSKKQSSSSVSMKLEEYAKKSCLILRDGNDKLSVDYGLKLYNEVRANPRALTEVKNYQFIGDALYNLLLSNLSISMEDAEIICAMAYYSHSIHLKSTKDVYINESRLLMINHNPKIFVNLIKHSLGKPTKGLENMLLSIDDESLRIFRKKIQPMKAYDLSKIIDVHRNTVQLQTLMQKYELVNFSEMNSQQRNKYIEDGIQEHNLLLKFLHKEFSRNSLDFVLK